MYKKYYYNTISMYLSGMSKKHKTDTTILNNRSRCKNEKKKKKEEK